MQRPGWMWWAAWLLALGVARDVSAAPARVMMSPWHQVAASPAPISAARPHQDVGASKLRIPERVHPSVSGPPHIPERVRLEVGPPRTPESVYGGWRLLQYDPLKLPDPLEVRTGFEVEDLKEQLLDWLPGRTLETVARTLTDRTVQLRLSSDEALVVVKVPIG